MMILDNVSYGHAFVFLITKKRKYYVSTCAFL